LLEVPGEVFLKHGRSDWHGLDDSCGLLGGRREKTPHASFRSRRGRSRGGYGCRTVGLELGHNVWISPDFQSERELEFAMLNATRKN